MLVLGAAPASSEQLFPLVLRGEGTNRDDALVVRRDSGQLYVGWLRSEGVGADVPLADAELPLQRVADVVSLVVLRPVLPGASVIIVLDSATILTLTAQDFAAVAQLEVKGDHAGTLSAIDLQRGFAPNTQLVSVVVEGAEVVASPPASRARPILYMNRRERFKAAWVDAAGMMSRTASSARCPA